MFGIIFNNRSLRTILTDYGFRSYPLMKNFPLTGFVEHYYDEAQRAILREPVELAQEYRMFVFSETEFVKNYNKGQ
jgi:NADH-quinone oxidoreductase subunit C